MQINDKESLWVEKYRPQSLSDCILPTDIKSVFDGIKAAGDLPNMILAGGPGQGKTTVAKALCEDLGYDWIIINASNERNIDVLRTTITQYASARSLEASMKCVILDEADYMNSNTLQPALRGALEEFSKNCRFIMTCNYPNKIIQALHSRCAFIDYQIPDAEKPQLAMESFKRLMFILDNEKVTYEKPALVQLVQKYFPDFRRIINECQRYSIIKGKIDMDILSSVKDVNLDPLVSALKKQEYKAMLQWVTDNESSDVNILFRKLYDALYEHLDPGSIPEAVLIIARYQYQGNNSADPRIQFAAAMTEFMTLKYK